MLHRFFPVLLTLSLVATPLQAIAQNFNLLIQQGNAASQAGNYAEAEAIFRQAIQLDPNDAVAYNNLREAQRLLEQQNNR
ncbi:MAG TPA: hypothetical protein DCE56_20045 [Cyanobacteria bacterium UBA8553]|nr:hypothetical protein [Cyanobacteria bacterium UBA8553]HAJ61275.1 hypothetical protein [Cyanobacteria bacterium UBA8543]